MALYKVLDELKEKPRIKKAKCNDEEKEESN